MIRRPPRSTLDRSSAASDVYKRQRYASASLAAVRAAGRDGSLVVCEIVLAEIAGYFDLSLIHISEPTRPY